MKRSRTCIWLYTAAAASMFFAVSGKSFAADEVSDAAKTHFRAGVSLLEDQDGARYEEAYSEFKASYAASKSPKVLGNIGFCAMMLERDGEAIDAYTQYLAEVQDVAKEERDQITRDLGTLKASTVKVELRIDMPNATVTDVRLPARGGPIRNLYPVSGHVMELRVRPGHHQITAKAGNSDSAPWDFEAVPGKVSMHTFKVKQPEQAPIRVTRSSNVMPWILTGAGGLMLAGGAITGILALTKTSDLEKKCPNDVCPAGVDLDSERRGINTFARLTDGFLIAGGVTFVGGLTWLLLSPSSQKTTGATTRPSFACTGIGCMAQYSGSF